MGREFNVNTPGENTFSVEFLRKKYRVSWGKVVKILSFYQEKERIFYKLFKDNRLPSITLNCPKLQELSDEYTQKNIKKMSGQTPDPCRDKVTIEEEKEEEKKEYSADFEKFYSAYPNRKDKPEAFKRWKKISGHRPPIEQILEAIRKQIEWRANAKEGEFRPEWKHPATWLNKGSWTDEMTTTESKASW